MFALLECFLCIVTSTLNFLSSYTWGKKCQYHKTKIDVRLQDSLNWSMHVAPCSSADDSFQDFMNTFAIVSSSGHVLWMFPAVVKTYCTVLDVSSGRQDVQYSDGHVLWMFPAVVKTYCTLSGHVLWMFPAVVKTYSTLTDTCCGCFQQSYRRMYSERTRVVDVSSSRQDVQYSERTRVVDVSSGRQDVLYCTGCFQQSSRRTVPWTCSTFHSTTRSATWCSSRGHFTDTNST